MVVMDATSSKLRRPTAVSQALRAIRDDIEAPKLVENWSLAGEPGAEHNGYRLIVAGDQVTRERAYRLAYQVYHRCGYVDNSSGMILSPFDALPTTGTLLIEDEHGQDVATASVVLDSDAGLPSDEIYREELDGLRRQGRRLAEVVRLAISDDHCRCKLLLIRLFNFAYLYAHRVQNAHDFVIEVNPRHVPYYRRLLDFEIVGPERPCPRVQNAPAVMLRLQLAQVVAKAIDTQTTPEGTQDRTLFRYCYSPERLDHATEFLKRNHHAMSAAEVRYFKMLVPEFGA